MSTEKERNKKVLEWGRTYAFGIVWGVDGVTRNGIDEMYLVRRVEEKRGALVEWLLRVLQRKGTNGGFRTLESRDGLETDVDRNIEMDSGLGITTSSAHKDSCRPWSGKEPPTHPN